MAPIIPDIIIIIDNFKSIIFCFKFIIIADGKNHQLYLDNFLKLPVDAQGNLEISPLRINADIYKFPETGSLRIVYSWPDSMK